ncbi:MAG: hypothetical protein WC749_06670 [Dehalococcoidia bacterium]
MNVFDEILTKAEEILRNTRESLDEYRKGIASKGSVADLLQEL